MDTTALQIQQRKAEYEKARMTNLSSLAVRLGHYVIKTIEVKTTPRGRVAQVANALWKSASDHFFLEDLSFLVGINSLYNPLSTGPKHISPDHLIDKVILIKSISVIEHLVKVDWEILNEAPIIKAPLNYLTKSKLTHEDISNMNRRYGIDEDPMNEEPYDSPDDL